jgi:hypothetical protein
MNTLAFGTGFFGTIWFTLLLGSACFLAGVIFKDQFLKLITGGRWGK